MGDTFCIVVCRVWCAVSVVPWVVCCAMRFAYSVCVSMCGLLHVVCFVFYVVCRVLCGVWCVLWFVARAVCVRGSVSCRMLCVVCMCCVCYVLSCV